MTVCYNFLLLGFDDMDSIYASPEDFKSLTDRDRAKGLHLLAYFVTRCHEIGVQMYICFEFLSLTEGNLEVIAVMSVFMFVFYIYIRSSNI